MALPLKSDDKVIGVLGIAYDDGSALKFGKLRAEWAEAGFALPFHLRIGGELNLASRLQSHADLGGILLADETYARVKDEIEAEELPPLTFKGFAYPIKTYRVIGSRIAQEAMKNMLLNSEDDLQLEIDSALKGPIAKRRSRRSSTIWRRCENSDTLDSISWIRDAWRAPSAPSLAEYHQE